MAKVFIAIGLGALVILFALSAYVSASASDKIGDVESIDIQFNQAGSDCGAAVAVGNGACNATFLTLSPLTLALLGLVVLIISGMGILVVCIGLEL